MSNSSVVFKKKRETLANEKIKDYISEIKNYAQLLSTKVNGRL